MAGLSCEFSFSFCFSPCFLSPVFTAHPGNLTCLCVAVTVCCVKITANRTRINKRHGKVINFISTLKKGLTALKVSYEKPHFMICFFFRPRFSEILVIFLFLYVSPIWLSQEKTALGKQQVFENENSRQKQHGVCLVRLCSRPSGKFLLLERHTRHFIQFQLHHWLRSFVFDTLRMYCQLIC